MDGLDGELHDVDVLHLVVASNVVDFAFTSFAHHEVDGLAVVFHVEPVAHVLSLAVDGELLASEDVVDDQRNELLGEVVGAVVVRAARDADRHVVGVSVGFHNHVGRRLRCGVGAVRAERRLLGEETVGTQRTVHLVGRYLVIPLACLPYGIAVVALADDPGLARGVEHVLRAEDVHREEELRILNRAVHVALGGEVHHVVHVVLGKDAVHQLAVADITLDEHAALAVDVVLDGAQVAGVGQSVEHNHPDVLVLVLLVEQILYEIGADKAGGTCYEIRLHVSFFSSFILFLRFVCKITK